MKERIQKLISTSGLASRRQGEKLIESGAVTVNGIAAKLGDTADPDVDDIRVNGKALPKVNIKTYIMLNKPKGYVTTMNDEKGRPCVSRLVSDVNARVYPVGRLDMYSEGLLIMTDDGELANKLMHPRGEIEKTYHAYIKGVCSDESLDIMQSQLVIDGYTIRPAKVTIDRETPEYTVLSVTIGEGRNRQVRKMCDAAGLKLTRLIRVSEGKLSLGDLKPGQWRYLTSDELQDLL